MTIKFKRLHPKAVVPKYAHGPHADAGMDLYSVEGVLLRAGVPTLVKTGFSMELPPGFEAQIRPRSGLALNHGITVLNSPGTIDPSYRGEVGVILLWNGHDVALPESGHNPLIKEITAGSRIAQMVIAKYEAFKWVEEDLSDSERGAGGFGSTGQ